MHGNILQRRFFAWLPLQSALLRDSGSSHSLVVLVQVGVLCGVVLTDSYSNARKA